MERIGCSLIDGDGNEVQHWGDVSQGGAYEVPNPITLPNGNVAYGYSIGAQFGDLTLVERWLDYGSPSSIVYDGEKVVVTRPAPVPDVISDRQFFQQLGLLGVITQAEALAAVKTGTIPEAMAAVVEAMPAGNEKFAAEMLLSGAIEFRRAHPLVAAFGAALGWTDAQIDQMWRDASAL